MTRHLIRWMLLTNKKRLRFYAVHRPGFSIYSTRKEALLMRKFKLFPEDWDVVKVLVKAERRKI